MSDLERDLSKRLEKAYEEIARLREVLETLAAQDSGTVVTGYMIVGSTNKVDCMAAYAAAALKDTL